LLRTIRRKPSILLHSETSSIPRVCTPVDDCLFWNQFPSSRISPRLPVSA
jgi:hypothetical protein